MGFVSLWKLIVGFVHTFDLLKVDEISCYHCHVDGLFIILHD